MVSDPIADMLTRIRNANQNKSTSVYIPKSKLIEEILKVLVREGFIAKYFPKDDAITVNLKYSDDKKIRVIKGLKRVSKPGLRVYSSYQDIPKVLNSLGIAILSTSKGILTGREAKEKQVGGELLAYVW